MINKRTFFFKLFLVVGKFRYVKVSCLGVRALGGFCVLDVRVR